MDDIELKLIKKIKNDIKLNDSILFEQIQNSSISDEAIFNFKHKIYRHLNDISNDTLKFKLLLKVENNNFIQYEEYSKDSKIKINKINVENNFILRHSIENIDQLNFASFYNKAKEVLERVNSKNIDEINSNEMELKFKFENIFNFSVLLLKDKNNDNEIFFTDLSSLNNFFNYINISFSEMMNSLLKELAKQQKKVGTINLPLIISETKQQFQLKNITTWDIFLKAKEVDVLFMENLNHLFLSEWFLVDFLIPLMEFRSKNKKVTLISLDDSLDKFLYELRHKSSKRISNDVFEVFKKNLKRVNKIY